MIKRVFVIVLDGAGVGALPDADKYGDEGSNTLGHVIAANKGLKIPHLYALGLKEILRWDDPLPEAEQETGPELARPWGAYGRMAELSPGKDTITGHWELAGLVLTDPFPLYPEGFPPEIIASFEQMIGRQILGNISFSGTEILDKLGEKHLQTGFPIVYTSADSVFQIAAHEEIVPLDTLYDWCSRARREIFVGKHAVGRIIARPFLGRPGNFFRTAKRKDYSLPPPEPTLLDLLKEAGHQVWVVGKIMDIFSGRGVTRFQPASGNDETIEVIRAALNDEGFTGFFWANLGDFDTLYGHRNDPEGYARALAEFDLFLGEALKLLKKEDMLVLTADHGCDPTFRGTDHTREYIPLLISGPAINAVDLGTRDTFADLGATVAEVLGCKATTSAGQSFAAELLRGGKEK
ncbi:MAG: phosphopentomutase [Firmicutes bacterium]|nr:phosphopentomutase [Bacillota bacterium]